MCCGGKKGKSHFAKEDVEALFRNFLHGKLFTVFPLFGVFSIETQNVYQLSAYLHLPFIHVKL